MKTIPFDYDKYISTFPRPKVFTKGGIEVLDFHARFDRETWKLWGRLATGPTTFCSSLSEDKDLEAWTKFGEFTVDGSSVEMKAFNYGGKYDLVMSDGSTEKVVYNPGLTFKIYNVYHDPARNTVFLDGGFLTPGEAMEHKGKHSHTYLGMFSLQDNPQFNNIFLDNGLAKIV
jgi:hypothetical protein